ncbi:MAG: diadenylate cyclase CdaA [Candidatus Marinimicrobia bacterium]|nr:diadenylate cyclase CdaA [Candidatus Neomarinimicrobiota bacterium]MDD5582179.1 diadenylate cyclase CdaA [Candidatus Neomarinimicrobiota bacterium]
MFELFHIGYLTVTLLDIIDILLVTVLIYMIYNFFRQSRAKQMVVGLIILILIGAFARLLNLQALSWILGSLQTAWLIFFVIVFQPELRRLLLIVGQIPLIRRIFSPETYDVTEELVYAVMELQRRKIGALIVVLRDLGFKSITEKGVPINGTLSTPLVLSIFNPESPLHDGAIIVYQDQVIAAKCILPLSENIDLDPTIGTRHLAALGLSEESDAFVIVVSEETGKISTAYRGILKRGLDESSLRTDLVKYLSGRNV